jgi:ABC-type multidrug transport system fused ATPase/permease subunit
LTVFQLWLYTCALFVTPFLGSMLAARSNIIIVHIAVQFRNALVNAIFRKALRLSADSRQQQSTGKIINMFANDTKQIQGFLMVFNNLLLAPLQIALTIYLIYLQVGVCTFVGLGYLVIITPLNGILFGMLNNTRKAKVVETDKRVKMMNEILNGIRVLKYYAWEVPFMGKVEEIRSREVHILCYSYTILYTMP